MQNLIKRDGTKIGFDPDKVYAALEKAFLAQYGTSAIGTGANMTRRIDAVHALVMDHIDAAHGPDDIINIEQVQNYVEQALMGKSEHVVAKAYILYRQTRAQARTSDKASIVLSTGTTLRRQDICDQVVHACEGLDHVDPLRIIDKMFEDLFDGATPLQVEESFMLATRPLIEIAPEYSKVAARLLLGKLRGEVLGVRQMGIEEANARYRQYFPGMIHAGIEAGRYDARLSSFELETLGLAMKAERDYQFDYLGLQTLYDRYFIHIEGRKLEMPQSFYMRIAMGLALAERPSERTQWAIQFYDLLSTFDYMSSTPTLFNAGCSTPQMSSCFLTTVGDNLQAIYGAIRDNALLSKFAGGIGNDWTPVRGMGSHIKGTNGESQGTVPFLKVANDTAIAVNQGGKRKGAVCGYLETWHLDMEEFLELRKNTGDDRRRTHDMNTANWIPDLFMERVMTEGNWTLFSPNDVPDLHDLYGDDFRIRYEQYERLADLGQITVSKRVSALTMWRKMLTMLFETSHPWMTFKDPCNIRSPQRHDGVVHSSNLCTEITLNTKETIYDEYGDRIKLGEIAVCNLGSVNAVQHIDANGVLDKDKLKRTVYLAMRALDNVIDVNFYSTPEARKANVSHRPVALGVMGLQEVLYVRGQPFDSAGALDTNSELMEAIAYFAYMASAELAQERGPYSSFEGSDWSQGIVPMDTIERLAESRSTEHAAHLYRPDKSKLVFDWDIVRTAVKKGMRNSNCLAIAPTATIANIVGVNASIEPVFKNCFVKENMGGNFSVFNTYLVADLRKAGLWDAEMIEDLKMADGSVQNNDRVPDAMKALYATAFEVDTLAMIEAALRRGVHIDQSQSLNIYMAGVSGKKLDATYKHAWLRGLKTTYYLRTVSASSAEKSTGKAGMLNAVKATPVAEEPEGPACFMRPGDPGFSECEACQ